MITQNIAKLTRDLERQELESPNGVATPQVYEQLLATYLFQNDLCNAKYLWKRISLNVKTTNAELGHIWAVGQHMWKRDFPAIYVALNAVVWSDTVSEIMQAMQEKVRSRAVDLISQAYSSISLDTVAAMTGLPIEVAAAASSERGWKVDMDTRMVYPTGPLPQPTGHTSSEDQLYKLTKFVSFLEN